MTSEAIDETDQNIVMGFLDKGRVRLAFKKLKELKVSDTCIKTVRKLLTFKDLDAKAVLEKGKEEIQRNEAASSSLANLQNIIDLTRSAGVKCPILVDLGFTRGLDYYTGMIFELFVPQMAIALGGGGRYDRLVELFGGESTPAVGCSPGIDRIALAMEKSGLFKNENTRENKGLLIVPIGEAQSAIALELVSKMREADIPVQLEVSGRGVRDALSYASTLSFAGVLLVGPREAESGKATLRDLRSKVQTEVPFDGVVEAAKSLTQIDGSTLSMTNSQRLSPSIGL